MKLFSRVFLAPDDGSQPPAAAGAPDEPRTLADARERIAALTADLATANASLATANDARAAAEKRATAAEADSTAANQLATEAQANHDKAVAEANAVRGELATVKKLYDELKASAGLQLQPGSAAVQVPPSDGAAGSSEEERLYAEYTGLKGASKTEFFRKHEAALMRYARHAEKRGDV